MTRSSMRCSKKNGKTLSLSTPRTSMKNRNPNKFLSQTNPNLQIPNPKKHRIKPIQKRKTQRPERISNLRKNTNLKKKMLKTLLNDRRINQQRLKKGRRLMLLLNPSIPLKGLQLPSIHPLKRPRFAQGRYNTLASQLTIDITLPTKSN